MIKGLTMVEVMISLTVCLALLSLTISSLTNINQNSKKIVSQQQRLESIFHTVDMLKMDLTGYGKRLQEAAENFGLKLFENKVNGFAGMTGCQQCSLLNPAAKGSSLIESVDAAKLKDYKILLLYDLAGENFEWNRLARVDGTAIYLDAALKNDYPLSSWIIGVKSVEYQFYPAEKVLKRKVDNGRFQPVLDEVSAFQLRYFPDSQSILYRLELNGFEQVRGYVFLNNMVSI